MADSRVRSLATSVGDNWKATRYYADAEQESWLDAFWNPRSPFRRLFDQCDATETLEIACGHGRHSAMLSDVTQRAVLLDINEENVAFAARRFSEDRRFSVMRGNGVDLQPLEDASFTLVFSYDAMVHFDDEVVTSYLRESFRVLKPWGKALLHHSNYSGNPGGDYRTNPHWRNFMTQAQFTHHAIKTGFRVLEAVLLGWGDHHLIDGLTLLEHPG
jgi:SAM-dependent methyltransferase